jgi:hypothetical protein
MPSRFEVSFKQDSSSIPAIEGPAGFWALGDDILRALAAVLLLENVSLC